MKQTGGVAAAEHAPPPDPLVHEHRSLRTSIESISDQLQVRPLLTTIVRSACELIGADNGTICLFDEARGVLRAEAVYRMPEDELGVEVSAGVGLAGEVLRTRAPVVLARYGDVAVPVRADLLDNPVIGMPVMWDDRMIGFFGIGINADPATGRARRRFNAGDVEVLTAFARHAAIAIENARRYEWEQRRTERLRLIAQVGHIITAGLRLPDLLERAADAIHELLGYPNLAIALLPDSSPDTLVLRTVGGFYKAHITGEYRIPLTVGIMGAAARTGKAQLVNDVAADPRYLPAPGATGIRAELAIPILLGERVLGVLNIESGQPLTESDAEGLQIVADQLAVAIENARLFERSQRLAIVEERQRLARELHDSVTQILFSMTLIAQSVAGAWHRDPVEGERRVMRLLELSRSALAEMRALLAELRPSPDPVSLEARGDAVHGTAVVRTQGLAAALAALTQGPAFEGLRLTFDPAGYRPQPLAREEALYRITQEALHNVVKHARARHVAILLGTGAEAVEVVIRDDGVGFHVAAAAGLRAAGTGYGLLTMRERVEALGGSLQIDSRPGSGTTVTARIPARAGS